MSVWTHAKRISKSTLAILAAVCALLLLCPVSPLPVSADTPDYMLMLDLSKDAERTGEHPLFTTVTGLEDGTYTFSFSYYSTAVPASGTSIYSVSWEGWQNAKVAGDHLSAGEVKTAQVKRSFAATDANGGRMTMGIDFHGQVTGGVIYAWNFKLTKDGDTTNLLPNPAFNGGSLQSWNYAFTGWFESSDPAPDPNGVCSAVAYDETLIGLDDGKTYMLKMDLDKAVSSGQSWTALNVSEYAGTDLTAEELPGTYTFSYDYYVQYSSGTGGIQNRIVSGGSVVDYGALPQGSGTRTGTFTVTAENPTFSLQLMAAESKGGVAYFWNLKLVRSGSSENRLVNKSLRKGTLKGWRYMNQYGYIPDDATEKEYFSVLEYDEVLLGLDDGKTYMLKMDLDKAVSSGQSWTALNVSEYAGTDLTAEEIPGTYTFSYDYFVQYSQGDRGIQNRINAGGSVVSYGGLQAGRGSFSHTFTVTAEDPTFSLQLMAAESKGGVAYFWNLKLVRSGSSENRLVNKSLRKGTLKGWRYMNQYGYISDDATEKEYFSVQEYDNGLTTLYGLGTSVRMGDEPGLRFGFTVANSGIAYAAAAEEGAARTDFTGDLSQASVLVNGMAHRILHMGVLVSAQEQEVQERTAKTVEAKNLFDVQSGVATFTAVIIRIPERHLDTAVYACPFVEYETEDGSAFLYGTVLSDSYNAALAKAEA